MENDIRPERLITLVIEQFKTMRLAQGMSHEVLARKTGVTRPAISHIESGKRKPSLHMSLKLAKALNHNLSDIIYQAEQRAHQDSNHIH